MSSTGTEGDDDMGGCAGFYRGIGTAWRGWSVEGEGEREGGAGPGVARARRRLEYVCGAEGIALQRLPCCSGLQKT